MCQKGSSLSQFETAVMRKTTNQTKKNTWKGVRFGIFFFGNGSDKKNSKNVTHQFLYRFNICTKVVEFYDYLCIHNEKLFNTVIQAYIIIQMFITKSNYCENWLDDCVGSSWKFSHNLNSRPYLREESNSILCLFIPLNNVVRIMRFFIGLIVYLFEIYKLSVERKELKSYKQYINRKDPFQELYLAWIA